MAELSDWEKGLYKACKNQEFAPREPQAIGYWAERFCFNCFHNSRHLVPHGERCVMVLCTNCHFPIYA